MVVGCLFYMDGDLQGGSVEECVVVVCGYIVYLGFFNVDDDGMLIYEMDVSLYLNWIGNVQQCVVSLDGNWLQFSMVGLVWIDGWEVELVIVWVCVGC